MGTLTVTGPTGMKAISGWYLFCSTAVDDDCMLRGPGAAGTRIFSQIRSSVANKWIYGTFNQLPLDSSKQCNWAISNATNVILIRIYADTYFT
jgi:hypothetical protein